jgi:DNA-binding transcriptional LysR family regulator
LGAPFPPGVVEKHDIARTRVAARLKLGATDYVGFVLLPHVFATLQQVAPQISLRVRAVEGPDALEPVNSGILDLAVGAFPQIPAGLRTEDLFQEEFVCLRRRRRRGASKMTVEAFAKLAHVLVVSPSSGMGPVDYALAKRGLSRHIAAYVPHFLVAPSLVAATDLVVTLGAASPNAWHRCSGSRPASVPFRSNHFSCGPFGIREPMRTASVSELTTWVGPFGLECNRGRFATPQTRFTLPSVAPKRATSPAYSRWRRSTPRRITVQ